MTWVYGLGDDRSGNASTNIHSHVPIFNTTWNEKKGRFQAGEFSQLHYDRGYYESVYMAHMAKNLQEVGYQVERNQRNFEIFNVKNTRIYYIA